MINGRYLKTLKKNFMASFYGWGSTASRLEPLPGGSILFTTKFPEIPGTHFIDLEGWKAESTLEATQWFWTRDSWVGNPAPELEYKGRLSKSEWAFFHFRILFFLKVWFFIQQKRPGFFDFEASQFFSKLKEKSHAFAPRLPIFKLRLFVNWSSPKTKLQTNFLSLENRSLESVSFSQ